MRLTKKLRPFLLTALCLLAAPISPANAAEALRIAVLSSRADMVTSGNALVEIAGADRDSLTVSLDGRDLAKLFRPDRESRKLIGRIRGLKLGKTVLEVEAGGRSARFELVNHPRAGPVFSGPHQKPFVCETERAGQSPPLDANCNMKTRTDYYYKSTDPPPVGDRSDAPRAIPRGFKPLDPSAPQPADLARTTTTAGETVDYVVRLETGTINRAIYQIAFLHEPGRPLPDPWTDSERWNGGLVYRFDGGCRAGYRQRRVRSALLDNASLSLGFAVAASSLNVFGNNCDDVISAETMMMVKEHFIESFGTPVHTIGVGGSGGSMQQHLIAQNYPELLDGIIPSASYPDIVTLVPPVTDCSLLARAFEKSEHIWTDDQRTAVSGFATWKTCESWMGSFSPGLIQPGNCDSAIPEDQIYDPELRPDGVRCGVHDNQVNVYGRDPSTGLARRTLDNVGVQYGMIAFQSGRISAAQFLELNENVGGYDADGNFVAERSVADPEALSIAYRTGRVNLGGGSLGSIPIIDARRYRDPDGNIHDRVRTFVMGARLQRANGSAANRVVLTNATSEVNLVGLMHQWLDNIASDNSKGSAVEKIARNKPAELADACWMADGERIGEPASFGEAERCNQAYPAHGDPRIAAGAPLANDILKCALKPVDPKGYQQSLTGDELMQLKAIFPEGVCDYSRPGVKQGALQETWLRY